MTRDTGRVRCVRTVDPCNIEHLLEGKRRLGGTLGPADEDLAASDRS
jgi:hypothetical protein